MMSGKHTDVDDHSPFPEDPSDTQTAIMKATFEALCKHGYADLTIKRISEGFPMSKSLLYHHYDGKDELLLEFLGYLLERSEEQDSPVTTEDAPEARLYSFIEHTTTVSEKAHKSSFRNALVEMRAQAAHDEDYRTHFTCTRVHLVELLTEILVEGIEVGVFREDINPESVAEFLVTVAHGSKFDQATTNDPILEMTHAEVERYIESCLLRTP